MRADREPKPQQQGKPLGWSFGEEGHEHLPRHELPSEHLHTIEIPAEPAVPAWDEPGYPDPDFHHAALPEGTRYWQGFAKQAKGLPPGEERPLNPGLVERITRKYFVRKKRIPKQIQTASAWCATTSATGYLVTIPRSGRAEPARGREECKMKKKPGPFSKRKGRLSGPGREGPMPAGSTLGDGDGHSEDAQAARQRDAEPDDFDSGTDVADDRVRGAGGQSLAELVISKEQGWGLDEHGGGLRHDVPEPSVNDYDPDDPSELDPETMAEEDPDNERIPKRSA